METELNPDIAREQMLKQLVALTRAELRAGLGRSPTGVPRTKIPRDLDPERIRRHAEPGVLLWPDARSLAPEVPVEKVGGYPNALPEGGWPAVDIPPGWEKAGPAPMSFIAQIATASLSALHPLARYLPESGYLLFFLDEFQSAEGVAGDPYLRPCRVVHVPALDAPEGHRPPPLKSRSAWSHHEIVSGYMALKPGYAADCYPAAGVRPAAGFTFRHPGFTGEEDLPFFLRQAMEKALVRLHDGDDKVGPRPHSMFGHPACNMQRCDARGDYPGILDYVPGAVADPRAPHDPPLDDPWVVLLQVASTHLPGGGRDWQMLWMDAGYLTFFVRLSALEANDWSAVVAVMDG